MALWYRVCFLHWAIQTSFVETAKQCNERAFSDLKPCGNAKKFMELTNSNVKLMDFKLAGKYCYGDSVKYVDSHVTRQNAEDLCARNGAKLAKFTRKVDWDHLLLNNGQGIFDRWDTYWISGKGVRKKWYWDYGNKTNMKEFQWHGKKFPWQKGKPKVIKHGDVGCLLTKAYEWFDTYCGNRKHFLCQKPGEGAYHTALTLETNAVDNKGARYFYDGDLVDITCTGRSDHSLKITIVTKNDGSISIHTKSGPSQIDSLSISNIKRTVSYAYENQRCFRYHRLFLNVRMSGKMQDNLVTCSHHDRTYGSYDTSFKMFLKRIAQVPVVKITVTKTIGGKLKPKLLEQMSYFCHSLTGIQRVTTLAFTQLKMAWAVRIQADGTKRSFGDDPPKWFQKSVLEITTGTESSDQSHYVDISLGFMFTIETRGVGIGCYSRDFIDKEGKKLIFDKNDPLSKWIEFFEGVEDISAELKIYNLTSAMIKGIDSISQCETFIVTCTGLGAFKDSISFKVTIKGVVHVWTFEVSRQFIGFATIKEVISFNDTIFGPSMKIVVEFVVQPNLVSAVLECENVNTLDQLKSTDSKRLNLRYQMGSLPPKLTSKQYEDDPEKFLTLKCTSSLGRTDTQSWKVLIANGVTNKITISKDGYIEGVKFPWLSVVVIDASFSSTCGQVLTTEVTMLKLSPKKFGVNFTCYSYNIKSIKPVQSRYPVLQLSATYVIFGGGSKFVPEESLWEYISWFLVLPVSTSILAGVFWFLARRQRKKARKMKKPFGGYMGMGDYSNDKPLVFEYRAPVFDYRGRDAPVLAGRSDITSNVTSGETGSTFSSLMSSWKKSPFQAASYDQKSGSGII